MPYSQTNQQIRHFVDAQIKFSPSQALRPANHSLVIWRALGNSTHALNNMSNKRLFGVRRNKSTRSTLAAARRKSDTAPMSLPPGFLDEIRSRTSLAAVVARKVTWDNRKSNPGKGDYWAPCPFHSEKTASFHVEDRKGFYYCFGCHAKGDALNFVRETDNVGFKEKSDQRSKLADVMEAATQLTRLQLNTSKATDARQYLEGRGLTPAHLERFEIGYVANDRRALTDALLAKNFPIEDIVACGLAIKPDDGGAPFDRFRSRIIFPIRDARGRAIAWGGRAMDPNARAKPKA